MELIADTTVLIDIWRYRRTPERLENLMKKCNEAALVVPWSTEAEFSHGALYKGVDRGVLESFYRGFLRLALDQRTMDIYASLWGAMARKGRAPAYPDLWIAASALARNLSVLTRNPAHFREVPNLSVVDYTLK